VGHNPNTEDSVERSLSALFESVPFQVDLMSSTPLLLFDASYYHHESNQLTLSQNTLDVLKSKQLEFQSLYQSRLPIYKKSVSKINHVWEKLNIPLLERQSLPKTLSQSDMEQVNIVQIYKYSQMHIIIIIISISSTNMSMIPFLFYFYNISLKQY
jgi:hypothetical protein